MMGKVGNLNDQIASHAQGLQTVPRNMRTNQSKVQSAMMYIQMIVYQAIPTKEITMSFQTDEATITGNTI